ncbi:hypothetical protein MATR_02180 [Marivirga tractuosa]|nr:hypothetical protein [Marivirga tractuosa]BDD13393.1 hypothetical protein MATR_02180 [Marivirga tractuosa]
MPNSIINYLSFILHDKYGGEKFSYDFYGFIMKIIVLSQYFYLRKNTRL